MSKGKKNLYQCQDCQGVIVTLDIDEGTTPFMLLCKAKPKCKGIMHSNFYRCDQRLPHHYEWFKPESADQYDPETQEHIRKGGLVIRRREVSQENIPGELLRDAIEAARARTTVSAINLQRLLKVPYPTASFLIRQLQERGIIFLTKGRAGEYVVVQEIDWHRNGGGGYA